MAVLPRSGGFESAGTEQVFPDGYATGKTGNVLGSRSVAQPPESTKIKAGASTMSKEQCREDLKNLRFSPLSVTATQDVGMLSLHGVADGNEIECAIHPSDLTVLQSIQNQEMFLLTKAHKYIDISMHQWPINVEKAIDVRACLMAPVRYGDHIGVVAGQMGDFIIMKAGKTMTVPMQDVDPVMVDKQFRQAIGGK